MTEVEIRKAFSDDGLKAAWESCMKLMRERGEDPDEVLRRAAENVDAWRKMPRGMLAPGSGDDADDDWGAP